MRKSGRVAQQDYTRRIEEYREMQLGIINNIYQNSNKKKIDKIHNS